MTIHPSIIDQISKEQAYIGAVLLGAERHGGKYVFASDFFEMTSNGSGWVPAKNEDDTYKVLFTDEELAEAGFKFTAQEFAAGFWGLTEQIVSMPTELTSLLRKLQAAENVARQLLGA